MGMINHIPMSWEDVWRSLCPGGVVSSPDLPSPTIPLIRLQNMGRELLTYQHPLFAHILKTPGLPDLHPLIVE